LKTKAEAAKALEKSVKLRASADTLVAEHGIDELYKEAERLKDEVAEFCISKKIDKLDIKGQRYGRVIQAVQERIWVATKDDIPEGVKGVKPLKTILSKELFMKVTKRVVDPVKLDEAVNDELITLDEISKAYVERMRKPSFRVFEEVENE